MTCGITHLSYIGLSLQQGLQGLLFLAHNTLIIQLAQCLVMQTVMQSTCGYATGYA